MGKVTSVTMTPNHVKAARVLLGLSAEDFAKTLPIGIATLRNFESGKEIKPASKSAIFDSLTHHGVRMQNGGRPGVRIIEPEKWSINLNQTSCPHCGTAQPALRTPKNLRQFLWGGWTCKKCGTDITSSGRKRPNKG